MGAAAAVVEADTIIGEFVLKLATLPRYALSSSSSLSLLGGGLPRELPQFGQVSQVGGKGEGRPLVGEEQALPPPPSRLLYNVTALFIVRYTPLL